MHFSMDDFRLRNASRMLALVLAAGVASALGAADESPNTPPDWLLEHNEFLTRGSGVFHTDNSPFRSDQEPWEAYGLEWEKGPSGATLHGRLFGIRDGRDVGSFWEYFVFWHPGEEKAMMYQVGTDGTVGIGTLEPPKGDGSQRFEQTMFHPDGTTVRIAHAVRNHGDTHATQSFHEVDGRWQARRAYDWIRQPAGAPEGKTDGRGPSESDNL